MKYFDLDKEEEKLLEDYETNKLTQVRSFVSQKNSLQEAARNTLSKTRNINIRLSERDLQRLKAKAAREGIPYQTLAASILHRVTNE